MFKKERNLKMDWDPFSIKTVINISTKFDRMQDWIDLISNNKEFYNII